MTKCPRCFSRLIPDQYLWMMPPHAGGPRYLDEVGSAFLGAPAECGAFYKWDRPPRYHGPPPPPAEASRALQGPVVEVCPVCHYQLPDGWRAGHATCIGRGDSNPPILEFDPAGKLLATATATGQIRLRESG